MVLRDGMCKKEQKIEKENMLCPLYNFVIKNNYLYCFSWKYNLFLKFCMTTGEIEYKRTIERYSPNAFMLFRLIGLEDKIVAIPYVANHIVIWDLQSMDFQELKLPMEYSEYVILRKFNTYVQWENKIFLFPGDIDSICQIDLATNNVKEVLNIRKYLLEKYNFHYSFFSNGSYLKNNNVYLGCFETNRIVKYEIITNRVELITINELDGGIRSICGNGSQIFILLNNGKLIIRNISTSETSVIVLCDENGMKYWNTGEERLVYYSGHIFAFAGNIEFSKKVRVSDKKVVPLFGEQDIFDMDLFFGTFNQGIIYLYSNDGNIYCFDSDTLKETGVFQLNYNTDELIRWMKKSTHNMKMIHEDKYICNISDMLDFMTKQKGIKECVLKSAQTGEIIYQSIGK